MVGYLLGSPPIKTMKTTTVKFLKGHPRFAHEAGETATLLTSDADFLIEAGYAVEVTDKDAKKAAADAGKQQAA